jgi:Tol biopolymer transport system component
MSPKLLPNGEALLFVIRPRRLDDLEGSEVALLDLGTGGIKPLGVRGLSPHYTSSGHLMFARADGVLMAGRFDQNAQRFTSSPVAVLEGIRVRGGLSSLAEFAISSEGDLLYAVGAPYRSDGVVWVSRSGEESPAGEPRVGWWTSHALSPDGMRLAVTIHRPRIPPNVYARAMPDGPLTRLTFGEVLDEYPVFLNDSVVLFSSPRGGNWDLFAKRWDGSAAARMILNRPGEIFRKSVSRDGEVVVFCELFSLQGEGDIYAFWPAADSVSPVVVTPFYECQPSVSPDGRWVAYHGDESGRMEVWVAALSGTGNRFQVSYGGGSVPEWSRDGRELYYVDSDNDLVAVRVSLGSRFGHSDPEHLFSMDPYDNWDYRVGPDGRFLMIRRHETEDIGHVVLVTNWTAELRRRVED